MVTLLRQFYNEMIQEWKSVSWMDINQSIRLLFLMIVIIILLSSFFSLVDFISFFFIDLIAN
ncbi:MAG: preprotein translocase subunit SecE [Rickettsiaceae bacterium H1]|nr:preprotein translocase subunit SecE [Rickettsiaceae bacterium H1]